MQNEDAIRAEALQDTKELFNILMYIHQMHESVVGLLSDLKSPDPDVAGTNATSPFKMIDPVWCLTAQSG